MRKEMALQGSHLAAKPIPAYISQMSKPAAKEEPDEAPRRGGRQPWEPTKEQRNTAIYLFGLGATQTQVAKQLGVVRSTVQRHLAEEFETGWELANLQLYGRLWKKAVKEGNVPCLIFLAKNRLGMSDRQEMNHQGLPPPVRQELCLRVEYVDSSHPRAFPLPDPKRLPPPD